MGAGRFCSKDVKEEMCTQEDIQLFELWQPFYNHGDESYKSN